MAVINRFDENFVQTEEFTISKNNFSELVLQINQNEPSEEFALAYSKEAFEFLQNAILYRQQLAAN